MNDDINIRSLHFLLVRTEGTCPQCGALIPLFGLAVPPGHMVLELDAETEDEDAAVDTWRIAADAASLFYVAWLPDPVQHRLQRLAPSFRPGEDEDSGARYWANHCRQCGSLLADHDLHCEPGGAFLPTTEAGAGLIQLLPIDEAFEAVAAGYAYQPQFFDGVR
jgi:ribosomal protein S27AE